MNSSQVPCGQRHSDRSPVIISFVAAAGATHLFALIFAHHFPQSDAHDSRGVEQQFNVSQTIRHTHEHFLKSHSIANLNLRM